MHENGAAEVDSQGRGPLDLTYLEARALPYLTPVCAEVRTAGTEDSAAAVEENTRSRHSRDLRVSSTPVALLRSTAHTSTGALRHRSLV